MKKILDIILGNSDPNSPKPTTIFAEQLEERVLLSATPVDPQTPADSDAQAVAQHQDGVDLEVIDSLAKAAIDRWRDAGITDEQAAALEQVTYGLTDLDGAHLAYAEGDHIAIDIDAAGADWFIDSTPLTDEEFAAADGVLTGIDDDSATAIDLLSVIMHEQGHILGLLDEYSADSADDIMHGEIDLGERRIIDMGRADGAEAFSLDGMHFLDFTVTTDADVITGGATTGSLRDAIIAMNDSSDAVNNIYLGTGVLYQLGLTPLNAQGQDGEEGGDLDLRMENAETLTIHGDGSTIQADFINTVNRQDRVFDLHGSGTVHFENLTITGGSGGDGAGVRINNNNATTHFNQVTLEGNLAGPDTLTNTNDDRNGGAVETRGNTTFTDSLIQNNASTHRGGGIWVRGGTADFVNTDVINNDAGKDLSGTQVRADGIGGALWVSSGQASFDAASSLTQNNATDRGGAIFISGVNSSVTMDGTTLTDNTAENSSGGAIFHEGVSNNGQSLLRLANMTVTGNTADSNGGAIASSFTNHVELENVTFRNNATTTNGGALAFTGVNTQVILDDVTLDQNQSGSHGGAMYTRGQVTVRDNLTITNNTAGDYNGSTSRDARGGGFYIDLANSSFNQDTSALGTITITGNTANRGGGFYNMGQVSLSNATISGNTAQFETGSNVNETGGGGVYTEGNLSHTQLSNSSIINNTSGRHAGGFYNMWSAHTELTDTIVADNTALVSGGGFWNRADNGRGETATVTIDNGGLTAAQQATSFSGNRTTGPGEQQTGGGFRNSVGTVTMRNLDIQGNSTTGDGGTFNNVGGGFHAEGSGGDVTLTNVNIYDNQAGGEGAGFYVTDSTVTMNRTTAGAIEVRDNEIRGGGSNNFHGGGFYAGGSATVVIGEGTGHARITGNIVPNAGSGGGFWGWREASITLRGTAANQGEISGHTVGGQGGGFRIQERVNVTLEYMDIKNNSAASEGGGFAAASASSVVTMSNGSIEGNTSSNSGAGGYSQGILNFTNVDITNNEITTTNVDHRGGGLNLTSTASGTLTDVNITGNHAARHGGGFWSESRDLTLTSTDGSHQIANNTAAMKDPTTEDNATLGYGSGGGFYSTAGSVTTISDYTISGNIASEHGGGFRTDGSVTLNDVIIDSNSAQEEGGGFAALNNAATVVMNASTALVSSVITNNRVGDPTPRNNNIWRSRGGGFGNRGTVELNGIRIANNATESRPTGTNDDRNGGGFFNESYSATVTLNNSLVEDNTAAGNGAGFYNTQGTVTFDNSDLQNNEIVGANQRSGGGFLNASQGTVNFVNGSDITGNIATHDGGGFYNTTSGVVNIENGTVSGNRLDGASNTNNSGSGAGFFNIGGASSVVNFTNSTLTANISHNHGGGFWNHNESVVNFDNTAVTANEAESGQGGGGFNRGVVNAINGTNIDNNTASQHGGGISSDQTFSEVHLVDSTMSGNQAGIHGGAIRNVGTLTTLRSTLSGNNAADVGGAIWNQNAAANATLSESILDNNTAAGRGGAIFNNGGGNLSLDRVTIAENQAGNNGGGIYQEADNSTTTGTNVTISTNTSTNQGGGIYKQNNGSFTLTHATIANNSATNGGDGIQGNQNGVDLHSSLVVNNDTIDVNGTVNLNDSYAGAETIGALANNGGFGRTHALTTGVSTNAIDAATGSTTAIDQIGTVRPQGSAADLGAFEVLDPSPIIDTFTIPTFESIGATATLAATASSGDAPLTYTWTITDPSGTPQTLTGPSVSVPGLVEGAYSVLLTVSDVDGDLATQTGFFVVNPAPITVADIGNLRTEIDNANQDNTAATITLSLAAGNYVFGSAADHATGDDCGNGDTDTFVGDFDITRTSGTVIIEGATTNAADTVIDAAAFDRVLQTHAGTEVILRNLTITGGQSCANNHHGGGIRNAGNLTLENVTVTDNETFGFATNSDDSGGGIFNDTGSTLTVIGGEISNNRAEADGGGVFASVGSTVSIDGTTIRDNVALRHGAGAFASVTSSISVANATLTGNTAGIRGGGYYNEGTFTVTSTQITDNEINIDNNGGGAGFWNAANGDTSITNSRLADNEASNGRGGAFVNSDAGQVTITNTDIVDNTSRSDGGGFYNTNAAGVVTITNSTISGNESRLAHGGAFRNEGIVNLEDVEITGNQTSPNNDDGSPNSGNLDRRGGGFYNGISGRINAIDTNVTNNVSAGPGGGFFNDSGTITFSVDDNAQTSISNNRMAGVQIDRVGGGFYNTGAITFDSVAIDNNTATREGGGFFNDLNGSVTVTTGGTIANNESIESVGGGFENRNSATVTLTNVQIDKNTALSSGGGFRNIDAGVVTINGGRVSENRVTAVSAVGGGFQNNSTVIMTDSAVTNNHSDAGRGGGIYQGSLNGSTTLTNTSVTNNTAADDGGGIFQSRGVLTVNGGDISFNSTGSANDRFGGGLFMETDATAHLTDVNIEFNQSGDGGGGIFAQSGSVINATNLAVDNNRTLGSDNITDAHGGGIYITGITSELNISGTFSASKNVAAGSGAGLFLVGADFTAAAGTTVQIDENQVARTNSNGNEINPNNGNANGHGGGIFAGGVSQIDLSQASVVTIDENVSRSQGGGVFLNNESSLIIGTAGANPSQYSSISDNESRFHGGGVRASDDNLVDINNARIERNIINGPDNGTTSNFTSGGGIFASSRAEVRLDRVSVSNNVADYEGGGIYSQGNLTINESQINDNRALRRSGGGIFHWRPHDTVGLGAGATITNSEIARNSAFGEGGGYYGQRMDLVVDNTTIESNDAGQHGGGLLLTGTVSNVTMTNSTISGNESLGGQGGGMRLDDGSATYTFAHVTVANNISAQRGGGIHRQNGTTTLENSIIANNTANDGNGHDLSGTVTGAGANLLSNSANATVNGGTLIVDDPQLGELAYNNPTDIASSELFVDGVYNRTHLISATGPAVDVATASSTVTTDQLGQSRPLTSGAAHDLGAVENRPPEIQGTGHIILDVNRTADPSAFSGFLWQLVSPAGTTPADIDPEAGDFNLDGNFFDVDQLTFAIVGPLAVGADGIDGGGSPATDAGTLTLIDPNTGEFTYTPPLDHSGPTDFANFRISVTDNPADPTRTQFADIKICILEGAIPPNIITQNVVGTEGTTVPLAISAALVDNDGSETFVDIGTAAVGTPAEVVLEGIPGGFILLDGSSNPIGTRDNTTGDWYLNVSDLSGLQLQIADDPPSTQFTVTVRATSFESRDSSTAEGTSSFVATVTNEIPTYTNVTFTEQSGTTYPGIANGTTINTLDEGEQLSVAVNFSDPGYDLPSQGTSESFTAEIDWGDGTVELVTVTRTPGGPGVLTTGSFSGDHTYADNGTYLVRMKVLDDDAGLGIFATVVEVNSITPTLNSFTVNGTDALSASSVSGIDEAGSIALAGTFSDPGFDNPGSAVNATVENFRIKVNWGDGIVEEYNNINEVPGGPSVLTTGDFSGITHQYADNGTYTVTMELIDDDGATATETFSIDVDNVPPFSTGLTATLPGGGTISLPTTSVANGATTGGTITLQENQSIDLSGIIGDEAFDRTPSFVDNPDNDPTRATTETLAVTIDWGLGGAPVAATVNADGSITTSTAGDFAAVTSPLYTTGGLYNASVTITDDDGGTTVIPFQVEVGNLAFTQIDVNGTSVLGGTTVVLPLANATNVDFDAAFFSQVADQLSDYTLTVDFGDGSPLQTPTLSATNPASTQAGEFDDLHTYTATGTYTVTMTVANPDPNIGSTQRSFNVVVDDLALTSFTAEGTALPANNIVNLPTGDTLDINAIFSDSVIDLTTPGETIVTIDWGEGSGVEPATITSAGTNAFTIADSEQYSAAGTYTVTLTFTNANFPTPITQTFTVEVQDEVAQIVVDNLGVTPSSIDIGEDGTTDSFTIGLDTTPTFPVTVTLTPSSAEVDIGAGAGVARTLTFSDTSLSTISVSTPNDFVPETTETPLISVAVTAGNPTDILVDGISQSSATSASMTVTITDDDVAGVAITQTSGATSVIEDGAGDTFAVALTSAPSASVSVTITNNDPDVDLGAGFGNDLILTFPSGVAAMTPQTVTVVARDDSATGPKPVSLPVVVTSTDSDYASTSLPITVDNVVATDVPLTVQDFINTNPTATPDTATTDGSSDPSGNVLTNDSDVDAGQTLSVTQIAHSGSGSQAVAAPTATSIPGDHGTLTILDDGSFSYTANPGAEGIDTFTYTVSDDRGGSSTETLTITVMLPTPVEPTPNPGSHQQPGTPDPQPQPDVDITFVGGSSVLQGFRLIESFVAAPTELEEADAASESSGPMLSLMPIFVGSATPGTVVKVSVRGASGESIAGGETTVVADTAGGWVAQFPNLTMDDAENYRIVIEQSEPSWDIAHGGSIKDGHVKTYFAPAISTAATSPEELTTSSVLGRRLTANALQESIDQSQYPAGRPNLDWRLN